MVRSREQSLTERNRLTDEPKSAEATPPFIKGSKFDANREGLGERVEVFKIFVQNEDADEDADGYDLTVYEVVVPDESEDRLGALHKAITPLLPEGDAFGAMAAEAMSLLNYFIDEKCDASDVQNAIDERLRSLYPERLDYIQVSAMFMELERGYYDVLIKEAKRELKELRRES